MKNILIYDIVSDSWLINNTTGNEIEGRTGHTAVMTTDKRIIVYGGLNILRPAFPYLAVLDTSKIPYEWSAPTEENSIGPITEHSSIIIKNYMITAFGRNLSERDYTKYDIKDVYKLNISNPLSYKWSLLATPNNQYNSVDNNSSIFDSINTKTDGVSVRWIVTIIVIVTAVIFLLILIIHKIIQRKTCFRSNTLNTSIDNQSSIKD
ncbi:3953_t:CDS:2 [Gigaspora rosea]|nr:3953_t:CDS:2 [Gigaspora rosea]